MLAFFRTVTVAMFCFFGVGCASLNLQQPTAAVTGMTVQSITPQGFTMNFDVNVTNPNSIALPLSAADYKLIVSGANLLEGKAKPDGSLPAKGSRAVALPITVTFDNLLLAEKAIATSGGNLPFDLAGGLSFDTGTPLLGQIRAPLSYSGTLPLQDVLKDPRIFMGSDAGKKLAALLVGRLFGR